ncbi:MAG: phosphate butyryltransferase [Anaerolineae bacterium]|nr:phosphate butyryltransferase [Anaerolineae bacterium]
MIPNFDKLVERAAQSGPHNAVIVYPTAAIGLQSALLAQEAGVAECTLVGDVALLRQLAQEHEIDLSALTLIDASRPDGALEQALHLCNKGQADVLVNDGAELEHLLTAILDHRCGLRADRLLTGVSAFDLPDPGTLLLVTDGIMLVSPDLEQRIAAIENAVHVAHRLGSDLPRVALVAATESVNPKSAFSVDAAQITVMARRHQIGGAIVDGPLGFDNAVSAHAAEVKGIDSEVAGKVEILVAPDLESGALLVQTLSALCHLPAAHAIVGGRAPAVLWSCDDHAQSRVAALALGALVC